MRMEYDPTYGLVAESDYEELYYRRAVTTGKMWYLEDHQTKQIDYVGVQSAKWALSGELALGKVRVYDDPTISQGSGYASTHILCTLTNKRWIEPLRDYIERHRIECKVPWLKQPGLAYEGVIAYLIPAKAPAILFKPTTMNVSEIQTKCRNYKACELFIENYAAWIRAGEVDPNMPHPPF